MKVLHRPNSVTYIHILKIVRNQAVSFMFNRFGSKVAFTVIANNTKLIYSKQKENIKCVCASMKLSANIHASTETNISRFHLHVDNTLCTSVEWICSASSDPDYEIRDRHFSTWPSCNDHLLFLQHWSRSQWWSAWRTWTLTNLTSNNLFYWALVVRMPIREHRTCVSIRCSTRAAGCQPGFLVFLLLRGDRSSQEMKTRRLKYRSTSAAS